MEQPEFPYQVEIFLHEVAHVWEHDHGQQFFNTLGDLFKRYSYLME